jgi:hypothetical protein
MVEAGRLHLSPSILDAWPVPEGEADHAHRTGRGARPRGAIHHPELVNLHGCAIGDETRIGAVVELQQGTRIDARCKISSDTFVCEGVVIEDEEFVGHGVMLSNDGIRAPRWDDDFRTRRTGR